MRDALDRAPEGARSRTSARRRGPSARRPGTTPRFVGGHPICGAETRGPDRASARPLRGRDVVPDADRDDLARAAAAACTASSRRSARALSRSGRTRTTGSSRVTSHLPHVLANVLLNQAGSTRIDGHDPLHAAGGSLRDMTRIGGANPRIWVDIFLDNREALAAALAEQRRQLEQVERALAAGDAGFLARWIGEASGHRRRLLATAFADPGRPPAAADPHLRPAGRARGDLPGARRRADQRRGLRARPRLPRAGRDADDARLRRGRGGARPALLEAQGYGVVAAPVIDE